MAMGSWDPFASPTSKFKGWALRLENLAEPHHAAGPTWSTAPPPPKTPPAWAPAEAPTLAPKHCENE